MLCWPVSNCGNRKDDQGRRYHPSIEAWSKNHGRQCKHSHPLQIEVDSRLTRTPQVTASHDPKAFANPEKVDLTRHLDSYIHYGLGPHMCLGYGASKIAMTTMLKTVAKLENLRRAPGPQGNIKEIKVPGDYTMYMTADHSSYFPFPTTMKVQWDGEIPKVTTEIKEAKE